MLKIEAGEMLPTHETLATPSVSMNHALNGGFWTGRISTLWGNPGSGKTTFALHLMAMAQELGYTPVIIDCERTYTDEWAKDCGIDIDKRIYIASNFAEDISKEILPMMRNKNAKYVFMVDSISTLVKESYGDKDDGGNQIGLHSNAQKWLTDHILSSLEVNAAVIYIAQQSTGFNQMGGFLKPNFGNRVDHLSTNIIKLYTSLAKDAIDRDKDTNRITSQQVTWMINKCKQNGAEGTKGAYWFNKETAQIEKTLEIVHIAKRIGIIGGNASWPEFRGEKYHGTAKLLAALTEEDLTMMEDTIMSQVTLGSDE